MRIAIVGIALAIGLAACGGSKGFRVTSPEDLRSKLEQQSIPCSGWKTVADANLTFYADAEGQCVIDRETVNVITFKDNGALKNWGGSLKGIGCAIGSGFGVNSFYWVEGNAWAIHPDTETTAKKIASAIGGTVKRTDC